jgi:hypothetical protein
MKRLLQLAGLFLFATCGALPAGAADIENPPVFKASKVLGAAASGPGGAGLECRTANHPLSARFRGQRCLLDVPV